MRPRVSRQNVVVGLAAVLVGAAHLVRGRGEPSRVTNAATSRTSRGPASEEATDAARGLAAQTRSALAALSAAVRPLSSASALQDAFRSYFAYKSAHPDAVRKPFLYFVDYGLPSTTPRGYVFDMSTLSVVEGPFTVAHGRGSSATRNGVPTRFSNALGSAATSLGLFRAEESYSFRGHAGGQAYSSVGVRLAGVSGAYNSSARARGVVVHGAPYVTPTSAGRSEGCPAMEQSRAARLLPKIANGGLVFLFAPDPRWLSGDPWRAAAD